MKTISKSFVSLAIVLTVGCSKKDTSPTPQNCASNSQKVIDAATVYGSNPIKANCEAYKNTVRDFYKSCQTFYTGTSKKDLDEFLAEPCPN